MKNLPKATIALIVLISLGSLLSLTGAAPNLQLLYLDASLLESGAFWSPFTYWLLVDKPASLVLIFLPLFLFAIPLERLLGARRLLALFFGGTLLSALVFLLAFSGAGPVKAAGGALFGGVSLAGAALSLSFLGKLSSQQQGGLPPWALSLLFLGGVAWTSFTQYPESAGAALAYRLSGVICGIALGLFWSRKIPSMMADAQQGENQ